MMKKKIEVVELNKPEEKIVLEEKQSNFALFLKKYGKYLILFALILLITGGFVFFKHIASIKEPDIKEVTIDTSLNEYNATISSSNNPLTEEQAKTNFRKNSLFKSDGEVLLTKKVESDDFVIRYFSDGTAIKIMKKRNLITRIGALENGEYGIDSAGIINTKAVVSDVTIKEIKEYPYGTITFYSDGSAELTNSKMDLFIRNANDVLNNYISNNKVTYLKETKNVGNNQINYYYDGTIEIIKDNKSYLLRNERDLKIDNNNIEFINNNSATIISTKKLADGNIIDYYQDGGAIIRNGTKTISVRKSNSIKIVNNKIFEIVDNIYVEESKKSSDGKIIYYTNGGAVIDYNGEKLYIPENSDILYQNDTISQIDGPKEKLANETNTENENILFFEETAVIKTKDYTAIVPKSSVIVDKDGNLKDIDNDKDSVGKNDFTISNNTNDIVKYRIVIEKSNRTTLDTAYIKYQLSTKDDYVNPTFLNEKEWTKDKISKNLSIKGTNYILYEGKIAPRDETSIKLMLWTDYETIPNSMQDKYFYGTIKVYAWIEE